MSKRVNKIERIEITYNDDITAWNKFCELLINYIMDGSLLEAENVGESRNHSE